MGHIKNITITSIPSHIPFSTSPPFSTPHSLHTPILYTPIPYIPPFPTYPHSLHPHSPHPPFSTSPILYIPPFSTSPHSPHPPFSTSPILHIPTFSTSPHSPHPHILHIPPFSTATSNEHFHRKSLGKVNYCLVMLNKWFALNLIRFTVSRYNIFKTIFHLTYTPSPPSSLSLKSYLCHLPLLPISQVILMSPPPPPLDTPKITPSRSPTPRAFWTLTTSGQC